MAFNMKGCGITIDNTPIYQMDLEEGVMGQANKNGSILINKNLNSKEQKEVIKHENIHLLQMKRGDLDYDNENVYWKGKKYQDPLWTKVTRIFLGKKKHIMLTVKKINE